MAEKTRNRCSPFTQEEKDVLKEVVGKFFKILENKKTDAVSASQKKGAWVRVADMFNSYANTSRRTPEQLKKAWENLKSLRKKQASTLTQHRMATGGGQSIPDLPPDPLMDMATPYLLETVDAQFDSDGRHLTTPVTSLTSSTPLASTLVYNEDLDGYQDNPSPHSSPREIPNLTTQVEEESTSRSRFPLYFDGQDRHLPDSSCTRDGFESGRSGTVVHFPRSATRTSGEGTNCAMDRSSHLPSATVVHSPSEERESPTVHVGRNSKRSVAQPVQPSRRSSGTTGETSTNTDCSRSATPTLLAVTNKLLSEEQGIRVTQLNDRA